MLRQFVDCPIELGNDRYDVCKVIIDMVENKETDEKEVQDTSCRGSGGDPQIKKVPQDWGI